MQLSFEQIARFSSILGKDGYVIEALEQSPFLTEWRGRWQGNTPMVLLPETAEQVRAILRYCYQEKLAIVTQGGNTGLVGGAIPMGEICLSTKKLRRRLEVDHDENIAIADAGITLQELHDAAAEHGLQFPLSVASQGSATIGGLVATNAGGIQVLRHGNMRAQLFGVQAVMADGSFYDGLRRLHKDNRGYDLNQLLTGSEGNLGIVTSAALKLRPRPANWATALIAISDIENAISLLRAQQIQASDILTSCEIMNHFSLTLVKKHLQHGSPFGAIHPWYLLIEWQGGTALQFEQLYETNLMNALRDGLIADAVIAKSESQRAQLWRLRENLSAAQKSEGPSLKHDISVPLGKISDLVRSGTKIFSQKLPESRPCIFGHMGDGNLHFNLSAPDNIGNEQAFSDKAEEITKAIFDLTHRLGGSFSAEHGIGVARRSELLRYQSKEEIELMRRIKNALDPNNILNPRIWFDSDK